MLLMELRPLCTGVELLVSDVYDSAFAARPPARSLAHSTVYRLLQRRMLGVRLALSGHFRCEHRALKLG